MDQELRDYLDRQSDYLERQFGEVRRQFAEVRTFQEEANRQFAELRADIRQTQELVETLRDENHQTRILVEKLDDKIDLVAEGVQSNTEVMRRLVDEKQHDFLEHKVVIESAHRHLEERVSRHDTEIAALGNRVRQLET